MANSPQAKKRARQANKHNMHNAARRSRLRTAIKKVVYAVEAGDKATAEVVYKAAISVIDSACTKGLIHRNKAARHKHRLNNRIRLMA